MTTRKTLATLAIMGTLGMGSAHAAVISVFTNASYSDVGPGIGDEASTIAASLTSLGHTVLTFSGITAGDWTAAGAAGDLILIPELQTSLNGDLTAAARTAIAGYVSAGGGFIQIGDVGSRDTQVLNGVFGYATSNVSAGSTSLDATDAAGTPFAGGPASLGSPSATRAITLASLPGGALSFYEDATLSTVWASDNGAGRVGYLGWDWFDAAPVGSVDDGWLTVLDRMVTYTAASATVPEPATLALLGLGLMGLAAAARRRA